MTGQPTWLSHESFRLRTGAISTNENLVGLPDQGRKTYIAANLEVDLYHFLKGQSPEKSQPTTYTFIAPKPNGVVDLYYWIFCPFNFGKKTGYFGDRDFRASAMFSSIYADR
jgi:hypothetical protein